MLLHSREGEERGMTRAELRRQQREQKKKERTYNLTESQLEAMKQEITIKAMNTSFDLLMGLPIIALHDKFGWGEKRLTRFKDEMLHQYEAFQDGYISVEDVWGAIEEDTNVTIRKELEEIANQSDI